MFVSLVQLGTILNFYKLKMGFNDAKWIMLIREHMLQFNFSDLEVMYPLIN